MLIWVLTICPRLVKSIPGTEITNCALGFADLQNGLRPFNIFGIMSWGIFPHVWHPKFCQLISVRTIFRLVCHQFWKTKNSLLFASWIIGHSPSSIVLLYRPLPFKYYVMACGYWVGSDWTHPDWLACTRMIGITCVMTDILEVKGSKQILHRG